MCDEGPWYGISMAPTWWLTALWKDNMLFYLHAQGMVTSEKVTGWSMQP